MAAQADIDLTPAEVAERHGRGEVELIDVREAYEWEAGRIAGARHVEMGRLPGEFPALSKERPVIFYCRVGGRSSMAARAFRRAGVDAFHLDGGLVAWAAEGRPLEPEGGAVAPH
jgi:rhodanese-related sulfurtransferase